MDTSLTPPVIVGLMGAALTGKTSTAEALAPKARVGTFETAVAFEWDHLSFALPLYRMARARQTIQGHMAFSRQCYEIHETLLEVFPRSLGYDEFVELVLEICELPIDVEGVKPRTFLQKVGTELCRAIDPLCWVHWMDRKVKERTRAHALEVATHDDPDTLPPELGIVISDVRFANEAHWVKAQPRGVLVKLTASPAVLQDRSLARDGRILDAAQQAHASEQDMYTLPENLFDAVIDTSPLTVKQQVAAVLAAVETRTRSFAFHA